MHHPRSTADLLEVKRMIDNSWHENAVFIQLVRIHAIYLMILQILFAIIVLFERIVISYFSNHIERSICSCVDDLCGSEVLLLKPYEEYEAYVRVDICGKVFVQYDDGYNKSTVYSVNEVNQAAAFVLALFE